MTKQQTYICSVRRQGKIIVEASLGLLTLAIAKRQACDISRIHHTSQVWLLLDNKPLCSFINGAKAALSHRHLCLDCGHHIDDGDLTCATGYREHYNEVCRDCRGLTKQLLPTCNPEGMDY